MSALFDINSPRRLARLIVLLALLPLGLLLGSWQQKRLADKSFEQANQAGLLRTQVLWVDSVTRQKVPVKWRPVIGKMDATREQIRADYPAEIGAGDAAWAQYKNALARNGAVDWNTTTNVRKSIATLSDAVTTRGQKHSGRAGLWMLLGALSMAGLALLPFAIASRLREAKITVQDVQQRFDSFMNNSPAVAFIKDAQGRYTYLNEPFERHFDAKKSQWLGKSDDDLWPPELAAPLREHDALVLRRRQLVTKEQIAFVSEGKPRYWLSFRFPLKDSRGNFMVAGLSLEITERKRAEQQIAEQRQQLTSANLKLEEAVEQLALANSRLETLAITDGLTSLKNRRAFNERLDEEFSRVQRHGAPLSLMLLDVDKFKQFNDTFGHPAGDEVLKAVAMLLAHTARSIDIVARYGGEEFAVISAQHQPRRRHHFGRTIPHQNSGRAVGYAPDNGQYRRQHFLAQTRRRPRCTSARCHRPRFRRSRRPGAVFIKAKRSQPRHARDAGQRRKNHAVSLAKIITELYNSLSASARDYCARPVYA